MAHFEANWERVDEDDPRRCQHIIPTQGQCDLKAVENSSYCPAHGGNKAFEAAQKRELRNYRLTKFKARVQELGDTDVIMSLREEIAVLRLLFEEKWNRCNENDLLLISGPLSDLVMKIEKVVVSCNRLEARLGNHLDRSKVLNLAQIVVSIIGKHITDEKILESISEEIISTL